MRISILFLTLLALLIPATSGAQSIDLLFPASEATIHARQSGDWSSPTTWDSNRVPGVNARVLIPAGVQVRVDGQLSARHDWIRVEGALTFASDVNTELRVETIVSTMTGVLEMGTAANPIQDGREARVIFTDDGPIDRSWDDGLLSRGAILMGPTRIHGAAKTSWSALAVQPRAGQSTLTLTDSPTGWRVGDELVVASTDVLNPEADDRARIRSIQGDQITLDQPLQFDHLSPTSDLQVHVANLTRNIEFTSEHADPTRRGHVMFMHNLDVDIAYARFHRIGRTDKSIRIDDFSFPDLEAENAFRLEGNNPRGRYAIHFHRGGSDPATTTPARVVGNVVEDNPGWGYVNHSSNVDFIDNVSYNVVGGAFQTEAGDESGSFVRNIALRTINSAYPLRGGPDELIDIREDRADFAFQGDGFWLHSGGVRIDGNVVAGASGHAFIFWTEGLVEFGLGTMSVSPSRVLNGHLVNGPRLDIHWIPLESFKGNTGYSAVKGLEIYYMHATFLGDSEGAVDQDYRDTLASTFEDLTLWSIERNAIGFNYSENLTFRDVRIVGNGLAGQVGVNAGHFHLLDDYRFENMQVEGFQIGMRVPTQGNIVIEGGEFRNQTDFWVMNPQIDTRTLAFRNVRFGDSPVSPPGDRVHIDMAADFTLFGRTQDGLESEDPDKSPVFFLMPDRITIEGGTLGGSSAEGVYYREQEASFIPIPDPISIEDVSIPDEYVGLTNQELNDRFGFSFGGAIVPDGAQSRNGLSNGYVGSVAPPPTLFPIDPNDDGDDGDDGDDEDGDEDGDEDCDEDGDDCDEDWEDEECEDDGDDCDEEGDEDCDEDGDECDEDWEEEECEDEGDDCDDEGAEDCDEDGDDCDEDWEDEECEDDGDDCDEEGDEDCDEDGDDCDEDWEEEECEDDGDDCDEEGAFRSQDDFELSAHPNPFNPTTTISYTLPQAHIVQVRVYDVLGRVVRTLVNGYQDAGTHTVRWDATDQGGVPMVSGTYFYQVVAGNFVQTKTMVLLK